MTCAEFPVIDLGGAVFPELPVAALCATLALQGREPGPGPSAVPGFLVPAGYGPSALSASAGRWQP
jgi:hypothetical protein